MAKETPLDVLGRFLMENLRDPGIFHVDGLLASRWKAPSCKELQDLLRGLSKAQRDLVRRAFIASLDYAIHDLLFALQEQSDNDGPVRIRIRGKDVASMSDGLQGELFTADGWKARFSKYGEPPEKA